jgi:GntR family transcriptional regulator, transcriptional repressor for pyruvate dehydrogenase complex
MSFSLNIPNIGAANIPDRVRDILKEAIYDGRLNPGDKLPSEEELRNRFKVSKTVMREALGQLVAEGLIKKRRGAMGGSFIAEGNAERILEVIVDCFHLGGLTIEEVMDFRRNIEPVVLEIACDRHDENDLKTLKKNLDKCKNQLNKGKIDRERQVEFHQLIAVASHNRLMQSLMNAVIKISREFTSKVDFSLEEALEDHNYNIQFFECIRKREKAQVRKLMEDHFERSNLLIERYKTAIP